VYVPGLSRAKPGGSRIVVVDADDELACERVVELFGETPGKVRTRRGRHYLYGDPRFDFGKVSSLKAFGVNADVKHGNSIVVAPWSRHEEDRAFVYTWEGCDETVIRELPPFDRAALQRLIENATSRRVDRSPARAEGHVGSILRDGSRKLELNDRLVSIVWSVSSEEELLEGAFKINEKIGQEDPRGPLVVDEVMETARTVWRDREIGKIEQWIVGQI
jgi:Bifunctional DNA primase/polymerase, N-terminal